MTERGLVSAVTAGWGSLGSRFGCMVAVPDRPRQLDFVELGTLSSIAEVNRWPVSGKGAPLGLML